MGDFGALGDRALPVVASGGGALGERALPVDASGDGDHSPFPVPRSPFPIPRSPITGMAATALRRFSSFSW